MTINAENFQTTLTERQHTLVMLSFKHKAYSVKDLLKVANPRDYQTGAQIQDAVLRIEKRTGFVIRTGRGTFEFTEAARKAEVHAGAAGNRKAVWNGKIFKHGTPVDSIDVYNMFSPISTKHNMREYRDMCKMEGFPVETAAAMHNRFIGNL